MNDKEIQQEFINFLAKKSGAKTEAELNKYLKSLSKEEQSKLKDEFTQYMQQKAKAMKKAEKGAKLNYIRQLAHKCAEGEELVYFKRGGRVDCGCIGKKLEDGGKTSSNNTWKDKFRSRVKKNCSGTKFKIK